MNKKNGLFKVFAVMRLLIGVVGITTRIISLRNIGITQE